MSENTHEPGPDPEDIRPGNEDAGQSPEAGRADGTSPAGDDTGPADTGSPDAGSGDAGSSDSGARPADIDGRFEEIVEGVDVAAPSRESELEAMLAERTEDLQRLQAEYVNYKRRVDRDRALSRQGGVEKVVSDLMPVLDSIAMARQHGELEGGFKLVADELEKVASAHGLRSFGQIGEEFDPRLHEALMQLPLAGATVTSVSQVMQPGYMIGDRVLRPARVAVSDPDPQASGAPASQEEPGTDDPQGPDEA
ncbi:nucleotide exchange factor GrpE [Acidipropionibacterium timonense]|uniref:nucleotide exchange factor GrpE n=1 Tax=Acidipropionibacterium timonense TaxID=2161818 RepID=UPI0010321097|nr:nucleotide exchange factor GrpE [Acidipropionibacterium timonense]